MSAAAHQPGGLAASPAQSQEMAKQEALVFKVMRLNRPSFFSPSSSTANAFIEGLCEQGSSDGKEAGVSIASSDILIFPPGFGNIYLGETFSAFVSASNSSNTELSRVEIKAELQTGTKRITLLDGTTSLLTTMAPKHNVDYVLEHELKEAGVHIMICTASYFEPTGEERKVRQYFKFQVQKPLSVTTKLHFTDKSIFLENQIQNITKQPLYLSLIKFESAAHYQRDDLSDVSGCDSHDARGRDGSQGEGGGAERIYGVEAHLGPGDVRQYLYKLTPKSGVFDPHEKKMEDLGRLEMSWKTSMGEPGRLHSLVNLLQWKLPPKQLVCLTPSRVPHSVESQVPFTIEWEVENRSGRPMELSFDTSMTHGLMGPILPLGQCTYPLGVVQPGAKHTVETQYVALETGLRPILTTDVCVVDVASALTEGLPARYQLQKDVFLLINPSPDKA